MLRDASIRHPEDVDDGAAAGAWAGMECTCSQTRSASAAMRTMRLVRCGLAARMRVKTEMKAARPVGSLGLCWM
jgi:hypothetical protein